MRGFTIFLAIVVGLTWALTVLANPEPRRIRNPFRQVAVEQEPAIDITNHGLKRDNIRPAPVPVAPRRLTIHDAPKRRRNYYAQINKQDSQPLSVQKITEK
ncbi:unnamed protein product [Orchesella dallaii]|uniref:Secreted protein n=1 Tax=Orchesella dallaii TaxID=48710 RepID=A0ABP1R7S5_9HEXA